MENNAGLCSLVNLPSPQSGEVDGVREEYRVGVDGDRAKDGLICRNESGFKVPLD